MKLERYNPRNDKADLEALIADYEYRSLYPIDLTNFSKELDERAKTLVNRNSIVLAKEEEELIGAGFFTIWNDFLGNPHCIVHDVVTRKTDSFKKGIEESVMRELFTYLKKTMKIDKIGLWARKSDSNYQSILMKLNIKKNDELDYYEHEL